MQSPSARSCSRHSSVAAGALGGARLARRHHHRDGVARRHLLCLWRGAGQDPRPCPRNPSGDAADGRAGQNIELIEAGEAQVGFVTMGVAQQGWNGTGDWTGGKQHRAMRAIVPDV